MIPSTVQARPPHLVPVQPPPLHQFILLIPVQYFPLKGIPGADQYTIEESCPGGFQKHPSTSKLTLL